MIVKDQKFYLTQILPQLGDNLLFTGDFALVFSGISVSGSFVPDVLVDNKKFKGMRVYGIVNYHYVPSITLSYTKPFLGNSKSLLSIPERTFVECIKYDLEFIEEGLFCDSLERYQNSDDFNPELLKEVAEHFEVPWEKIEYWLKESEDYNSH